MDAREKRRLQIALGQGGTVLFGALMVAAGSIPHWACIPGVVGFVACFIYVARKL